MDKKVGKPLLFRESEAARFARGLPDIQKYLTFIFTDRKREDVGLVRLLAIFFVHGSCERIAADDKRKLKTRTEDGARDFFKRNMRRGAANSTSYVEH